MPALAYRKDSKGQVDGNGYPFKFGVDGPRYGQLLVDKFHLVCPEGKVRRVEVARRKLAAVRVKIVYRYLLDFFTLYKNFSLLRDGVLCKPTLCFRVIRITSASVVAPP